MTTLLKVIVLWTAGALAVIIPLSRVNLPHYQHLPHGVRTRGMVTALEPTNHQAVRYSFRVADKEYLGAGRAGFGNPEFGDLSVGGNVIVYYVFAHPDESCVGIPDELVKNEVAPIVLAGITFPAFALTVWTYRYSRFKRWLFN